MSDRAKRVRRLVTEGLSVVESAAVLGLCRSVAYELAGELGLVQRYRLPAATRRKILTRIERGETLAAIAAETGCAKTTVLRVRDQAARRGAACERHQFRRTRSAYECPTCGRLVRVSPCVACAATGVTCQPAR